MYKINDPAFTAVHCIGNGKVCVYGTGINLIQMFGPDYSSPDIGSLCLETSDKTAESVRIFGTSVWKHTVYSEQEQISEITDFALPGAGLFMRLIDGNAPMEWHMVSELQGWKPLSKLICGRGNVFWVQIPEGTRYYTYSENGENSFGYVTTEPVLAAISFLGAEAPAVTYENQISAVIQKGAVAVAFAKDITELVTMLKLTSNNHNTLLEAAVADGKAFSKSRQGNLCLSPEIEPVAEDIAFLIRGQQSDTGGVLAGPNYHLAYIRDNYGVLRGLLSVGCYNEARALLDFYIEVFARHGRIQNAQETACYGKIFHIHEHDEVEITSYIILMVLEYYKTTGDDELMRRAGPLMWWCVLQQHKLLKNGMLPFNGDETYIAGSILPRTALNDGSMEATALYYEVCTRLISYVGLLDLSSDQAELLRTDMREIKTQFETHFIVDGRLATNCPGYFLPGEEPQTGRGVYLCGHNMGVCGCRNAEGLQVCPDCVEKTFPDISKHIGKRFFLPSAALMLLFSGVSLIPDALKKSEIDKLLTNYRAGLSLSGEPGGVMVGYEYGSLLYALLDYPEYSEEALTLLQTVLDVRDDAGAWVEYYVNKQPVGCRCRPWESGINIAAAIKAVNM